MNKLRSLLVLLLLFFSFACDKEDELIEERLAQNPVPEPQEPTGDPGTANFTRFVTLGNSLIAGLMDAALYTNGQQHSIANLMARQLMYADGDSIFNQPDINAVNGFNIGLNDLSNPAQAPTGRFILKTTAPAGPIPTVPGDPIVTYGGDKSALDNFGVPGARVIDAVTPGYGQFNPFFGRFASSPTASMLGDALAANPTFFVMWLGSNDVVGFANAGAVGPDGEENPEAESNPATATFTLTSISSFNQAYQAAFNAFLAQPDRKGVVVNIPNVLLLPYFRAVPWNPLPLNESLVNLANSVYQQYNGGLDAALSGGYPGLTQEEVSLRKINFQVGQNAVVITDEDLTEIVLPDGEGGYTTLPRIRQITSQELLTFPAATVIGTQADPGNPLSIIGVAVPLSDRYVLTANEIGLILSRMTTFNEIIANAVANSGGRVALWNANSFFTDLAINGGIEVEGQKLLPDFSPNGVFSTDGIHPNPRGNAIAANEIIKVIEASFGAQIPKVEVLPLRSVIFQ